jgi:hypothetical protein
MAAFDASASASFGNFFFSHGYSNGRFRRIGVGQFRKFLLHRFTDAVDAQLLGILNQVPRFLRF